MKLPAIALSLAISIPLANAYTGDLTYYTPGANSCGTVNKNGDAIVALSHLIMSGPANPNDNPICNKQISIHNPATGSDTTATVTDTCEGCAFGDLDVPPDLFSIIAPNGNGRVHGIQWTPIGWTVPGGSGESDSTPSASPAVQPSSSAAAAVPSTALPSLNVQEKVAAVVPSAAAAAATPAATESSSTSAAPSNTLAASPSVAPAVSPAQQASSAPTSSAASCTTAGETVCSADGTQIGTCTAELTVQFGPVALGTKCEGGYMVMANSRLRNRRG